MNSNNLSDLNGHLFSQLERLNDENITDEGLQKEIERTKAITSVAKEIINNGRLILDATVKAGDQIRLEAMPKMLK